MTSKQEKQLTAPRRQALTATTGRYWKRLSPECKELAQTNPRWAELVEAGKFEEEKALAALACTTERLANIYPASIPEARDCGMPALSTIGKYKGKQTMEAFLQYVLTEINVAFGEKKGLSPAGLQMVGRIFAQRYWHWNLGEVRLAIQMGISGDYQRMDGDEIAPEVRGNTKAYGAIDAPTIMSWFHSYDILKAQWASEIRASEAEVQKLNEQQFTEEGREVMLKILGKLAERRQVQEAQEEPGYRAQFYRTIEEYCHLEGIDKAEYLPPLEAEWEAGYRRETNLHPDIKKELPWELYRQGRYQKHLVHLNDGKEIA